MAVGLPDAKLGEKVVFVTEGGNSVLREEIKNHIKDILHPFEIPRLTQRIVSFPRTRTGKWDRQKVHELLSQ